MPLRGVSETLGIISRRKTAMNTETMIQGRTEDGRRLINACRNGLAELLPRVDTLLL